MASQSPQPAETGRKASQAVRALQAILDGGVFTHSSLENLKTMLTFAEARTARLLDDKEDLILELQTKAFRTDGLVKDQKVELQKVNEKLGTSETSITRLENKIYDLAKEKDELASDLRQKQSIMGEMVEAEAENEKLKTKLTLLKVGQVSGANLQKERYEKLNVEHKVLMEEKQALNTRTQRMAEEKRSLEQRESSWMDVISSLRSDKANLEKQLAGSDGKGNASGDGGGASAAKKRKVDEIFNLSTDKSDSEEEGRVKHEPVERPLSNVKHWAPEGYYHVKEHFRKKPVRKTNKNEGTKESEPKTKAPGSFQIVVLEL